MLDGGAVCIPLGSFDGYVKSIEIVVFSKATI